MKLEINGVRYYGFTSATAKVSIDSLPNTFSFTASPGKDLKLPVKMGDTCIVYVSDVPIITGHIDAISGSGDQSGSNIDILGRDGTADFVDSQIGALADIATPVTLKRVIEIILSHIGAEIDVIDLTGAMFTASEDIVAAEPGDNAFEFAEKLARKKSVIITSDSEGNVVLQSAIGTPINTSIIHRFDGIGNNVISYSFTYDDTQRFNKYQSISNLNVNTLSKIGSVQPNKLVNQNGSAIDSRIREGRQFVISSENPGASGNMQKRAIWEANIRKSRSRQYSAIVAGYTNSLGEIWTPNTIVKVVDDRANIDDFMLINSVVYRLTGDEGSTTEISLINKDAYKLEVDEPDDEKRKKKSGNFDASRFGADRFTLD